MTGSESLHPPSQHTHRRAPQHAVGMRTTCSLSTYLAWGCISENLLPPSQHTPAIRAQAETHVSAAAARAC